jgi:hypothetical protein
MTGAESRNPSSGIDESLLRECGEVVAEYGARLLFVELRKLGRTPDQVERARLYPIFARHLASAIPHALAAMRVGLAQGTRFAATGTAFVTTIREAVLDAIEEAYPGVAAGHPGPAAPPRT